MNEIDKQLRQGINLEDYYPSIDNYIDGVTYYGSSLLLDSTTSIIHYFLIDEEIVNVDELTFQADSPEFSYEVICQKNEDLYEVEIRDIYAQNLEDELILSVNGGELTLNYNAFSFGYLVMNANENEALMNVVRALYDYNQAANNYL